MSRSPLPILPIFSILSILLLLPAHADDDRKLRPLEYNNPGLTVDLGVGLWAWPMPMDYDDDGDLDLLVACPDKPSNGVYLFANPTQDPKDKLPVFKKSVHLGRTTHNFQVSYVDGQPRILKPGCEFPRSNKTGRFCFDAPQKIYPTTRIHPGKTRANMWRYVDFDGDGDHDIIAGVGDWSDYVWDHAYNAAGHWCNGPLHGYVYLIANGGSDEKPDYSDKPFRLQADASDIDIYGWPSPNFADFDGDGDLDLLCGEFLDGFTYFRNIGSRTKPEYAGGVRLKGDDGKPLVMHLQMITPTAIDWDKDGDQDLIVGDEDGRVALVENVSPQSSATPVFKQPVYFQQQADTLKFGALATPFAHDWDGDGDEDILCGNTAGNIAVFTNLDSKGTKWSGPQLLEADGKTFRILAGENGSIQGPAEAKWGYTTISVADWDKDGRDDILVNSIWPELTLLKRTDTGLTSGPLPFWTEEYPPAFYWWKKLAQNTQTQWRTTPLATDFDRDGKLDLVILDQEGYLTCQSRARPETRIFIDEDNRPIRLATRTAGRSGRFKLAVTDWDADGRDDILVNSENATWYRNCADRDGKIVLKKIGNLAKRNVSGHTSSPAVCDFDRNGKPDLLVGSENGRIYFIRHEDCISYPADKLKARAAKPPAKPRFPGLVKEEFIFTKAPFKQCHASTICETTRGLVAAWFGGTREKNPDVGIWSSYNDGAGWTSPTEWANGEQADGKRHPCWNPVLFQADDNSPLLLFFKVGPDPRSWWGELIVSYDRGRSFRDRRRLPEQIIGPVRCKPALLPDGKSLLCGSSTEHDGWRVHFEKVPLTDGAPDDDWKRIGPIHKPDEFNAIQPTFLRHPDGKLQVLCRTREGVISTSHSTDGGESWSKMEATNLPNNNSGVESVTLEDGRHLLVYNHLGSGKTGWGRRGMLNLAVSEDGKSWHKVAILEQEKNAEFSYPAIIQAADGLVHITYTWKRQRVKHVVINSAHIETGEPLSLDPW